MNDQDRRNTRQKTVIRETITESDRPLSPEEILEAGQKHHPGLGIATVYRNIQALTKEGWLRAVVVPGDSTRYERAGKGHHHHFQCNECGKVYDLEGCAVPQKPKLPRGFSVSGHELYVFGTCAVCARPLPRQDVAT